jgi:Uma2 family endonuclease
MGAPEAIRHTPASFFEAGDDKGFELIDGMPRELCSFAAERWLAGQLIASLDRKLGPRALVFPRAGLDLWAADGGIVRKPDVAVIAPAERAIPIPKGWLEVVPTLVADVAAPGETAEYISRKLFDYRRAGISLVWVIHPETRTAYVHRGERIEFIDADGVLDGGEILPGFSLSLAELFAWLPPT